MRAVRGRDNARWLPSRHNAALFRFLAWVRLRYSTPSETTAVFVVDRHQSAAETYVTAAWVAFTATGLVAAIAFPSLPFPLSIFLGFVLAVVLLQLTIAIGALIVAPLLRRLAILRTESNIGLNSTLVMMFLAVASVYLLRTPSWARVVAYQFFAALLLNGIAAIVVLALRGSIERAESAFGGESFVP